jgi:hypothetical protein
MEGIADLGQQFGRQLGVLALMQGLDAVDRAELGCQLVSQDPIADEANGRLDIALFVECNQPIRQAEAPVEGLINRFKQVGT